MSQVTVSIPCFKIPGELVTRSVTSILEQTFEDFDLWVVSDGDTSDDWLDTVAELPKDERLIVITHGANRGRYAIDHEIVNAVITPWWAPLDADDWAEPRWLEAMMDAAGDHDVVFAPQVVHHRDGVVKTEPVKHWDGSPGLGWHAHLSNLWSVPWLQQWQITNPRMRIGWDSVMTSVPWLLGNVKVLDEPYVHRVVRDNSLTTSKATKFGSAARLEARRLCGHAWRRIVAHPNLTPEIVANVG